MRCLCFFIGKLIECRAKLLLRNQGLRALRI
jgi:hypothetical protein